MIVVLDSRASFNNIDDDNIEIYWGGYLGSEDGGLTFGQIERHKRRD